MAGYDAKLYRDDLKVNYLCKKCKLLLKRPVQDSENGFRYCKKCTQGDKVLSFKVFYPDKAIEMEMAELTTCCKYSSMGCYWTGELKKWETHVFNCEYKPMTCSTCKKEVARKDTGVHSELCKAISPPSSCQYTYEEIENNIQRDAKIKELDDKLNVVISEQGILYAKIEALKVEMAFLSSVSFDGTFLWKIPDIYKRRQEAMEGTTVSIYSPSFYTARTGYKMCMRAYLNGDGIGKGSHVSLFWVLMRGDFDDLLQWPLDSRVTIKILDQDGIKHISDTFVPNPTSSSFFKPKTEMNIATGFPRFAKQHILDIGYKGAGTYVRGGNMYVKCIVDTTGLKHP